jgi:hypothetical protein
MRCWPLKCDAILAMRTAAVFAFLTTMTLTAEVKIEKTAYQGWPNCYKVSNGTVELIVTSDIGPRIMRYAFVGGQNFFWNDPEGVGKSGEPAWQLRGGHRVWVGPEDLLYTYPPDNSPIQVEVKGAVLIATQPVEKETGIQKQLVIRMDATGAGVEVSHRLTNKGVFTLDVAVWALTMMAPGGRGMTGFPPRGTHDEILPPTNPLVMWAYTDLADTRWTFTKKYMMLQQDPKRSDPQKLGHFNAKTWAGYLLGNELFVKRSSADPSRTYPDFGCSYETYTNDKFLEIETLGPMTKLPAGGSLEHTERWSLYKNISIPAWTDAELDRVLLPILNR